MAISSTDVDEKSSFRPISYPLYHTGSNYTNLMSSPFCKVKSVASATCAKLENGGG